jgi:flagellar biosynthesis anti-sigma factor FlgM
MTVNLNGLNLSGAPASSAPKASTTQSPTASSQDAKQQGQAEVSITSTASLLAQLQRALAAKPAVEQGRVDAISKMLAAGIYKVSGDNIARGLINTERALGQLTLTEI